MDYKNAFVVLTASVALAACGGSGDSGDETAMPSERADTETQTASMGGLTDTGDMEAEAPDPDPAPEADPEPADVPSPAEDAGFMVAGLTGNADAGRRVWTRCMSCHVLDEGVNRVGPSLYGIIGREAGTVEGFRYSDANANSSIIWTEEIMFDYLENPREYIPGTFMAFPGLPDAQQRADIIAYIRANGGGG